MNSQEVMTNGGTAFGAILFIGIIVIGLAMLAIWLWSLIHCVQNKHLTDMNRICGILLIVILGPLGSFVYLFLPREQPGIVQTE